LTDKHTIDMHGKTVLVTGGTRGLGREMALGFARAGADLVIASRKQEACDRMVGEIEALGRRAVGIAAHVANWQQCDALVEQAYASFPTIDVLINNAGMSPLYPSLAEVSEELYDKVLGVNLKGPFRLSALIGERMFEGDGGAIINISSIAAVKASWTTAPYSAAKAGLNALTKCLADAYGPKVRANCIMCGPFRTDVSKGWADSEEFLQRAQREIPMKRIGEPDEVVGAALYFASAHASYTTGTILTIDGGET